MCQKPSIIKLCKVSLWLSNALIIGLVLYSMRIKYLTIFIHIKYTHIIPQTLNKCLSKAYRCCYINLFIYKLMLYQKHFIYFFFVYILLINKSINCGVIHLFAYQYCILQWIYINRYMSSKLSVSMCSVLYLFVISTLQSHAQCSFLALNFVFSLLVVADNFLWISYFVSFLYF